jgi:hypothetical protein
MSKTILGAFLAMALLTACGSSETDGPPNAVETEGGVPEAPGARQAPRPAENPLDIVWGGEGPSRDLAADSESCRKTVMADPAFSDDPAAQFFAQLACLRDLGWTKREGPPGP